MQTFEINYDDTISSGGSVQDAIEELITSYKQVTRQFGAPVRAVDVPLASMSDEQKWQLAAVVPRALWRERNHSGFGEVNFGQVTNTIHLVNTDTNERTSITQFVKPHPRSLTSAEE